MSLGFFQGEENVSCTVHWSSLLVILCVAVAIIYGHMCKQAHKLDFSLCSLKRNQEAHKKTPWENAMSMWGGWVKTSRSAVRQMQ